MLSGPLDSTVIQVGTTSLPQVLPTNPGPGVAMVTPPEYLLPSISASISKAMASIPPDHKGALVGIVTERGTNLAIVQRFNDDFQVSAWIGRSWEGPSGEGWQFGAEAKYSWK